MEQPIRLTLKEVRVLSSEEGKTDEEIAEIFGLKKGDISEIRREHGIIKKKVFKPAPKRYVLVDEDEDPDQLDLFDQPTEEATEQTEEYFN